MVLNGSYYRLEELFNSSVLDNLICQKRLWSKAAKNPELCHASHLHTNNQIFFTGEIFPTKLRNLIGNMEIK